MHIRPKQIDLTRDLIMTGGTIRLISGTAANPALRFVDHSNTGIYLASAAKIGFSTSGVQRLTINTVSVNSSIQLRALDGTVNAPAYSFTNSTNSGLFWNDQYQVLTLAAKGWDAINVFGEGTVHMNGTGALAVQEGSTSQRPANPLNGMLRYNDDINKFEFYQNNQWEPLRTNTGTVTEVRSGSGLTGGPITSSGELSLAGAPLSLFNLANTGMLVRNNFGSVIARSLATASSARIVITNPSGNGGDPTVDLATTGVTNGTYSKLTVDAYGRVTAATQLAASDITTALNYTPFNAANAATDNIGFTVPLRNAQGNFSAGQITASLIGNASTALKLLTARTISVSNHATGSVTFDGSANADIALTLAATGVAAGTYHSVTVDTYGRVTGGTNPQAAPLKETTWFAPEYDSPNNANWAVNSLAPAYLDPTDASITVRGFDDSTEEAVGFFEQVPSTATNVTVTFVMRPTSTPSSTANNAAVFRIYNRRINIGAAVGAWSSPVQFNTMSFATGNSFFQQFTQTLTLAQLGVTAGATHLFELTRYGNLAADNLVGDAMLLSMKWVWQ